MKRLIIASLLILFFAKTGSGQNTPEPTAEKKEVYRTKALIDGPIIVGGLVANYFGIKVLKSKPGLSEAEVAKYTPEDINKFDRGATRQNPAYANTAMKLSDLTLTGFCFYPAVLLLDKHVKKDALKVGVVLLTTMSIMSNCYSWGVGHINRFRPYVYNPEESMARRTRNGSRNSFYGGHAAAAASLGFFVAKVYHDYHPGSKLTPWLFGAALIPPTVVGYFRYKSGMHFPSDLIAGSIAGAFIGIIVPQLHKPKHKNVALYPMFGPGNGVALEVRF